MDKEKDIFGRALRTDPMAEARAALDFAEYHGVTVSLKAGRLSYQGAMRPAVRQAIELNRAMLPAVLGERAVQRRNQPPRDPGGICAHCGRAIPPWDRWAEVSG